MSANLQYKELISMLHHLVAFKEVYIANCLSRPTKINGITLVLHVNCSFGCR